MPVGAVTLALFGQGRRIRGGPFDEYEAPAIGLCLESRSARAAQATLLLDLPDYHAPEPAAFVATLAALLRAMRDAPEREVYIGCRAGIGRTGTFIAGLARVAGHAEAVAWTRLQYHPRAVETPAQEAAVAGLDPAAVWAAVLQETA